MTSGTSITKTSLLSGKLYYPVLEEFFRFASDANSAYFFVRPAASWYYLYDMVGPVAYLSDQYEGGEVIGMDLSFAFVINDYIEGYAFQSAIEELENRQNGC